MVQLIHCLLQAAVHGSYFADNADQNHRQDGGAHHKYKGQGAVHPKGQDKPHNQHHRAADQRAKAAVDRILQHCDVSGHPGNQRGGLKVIKIGEGIFLNPLILRLPDPGAPAVGGSGCKAGVEQAGNQGQNGTQGHLKPFMYDKCDILIHNAHINQIRHQDGDDQFKAGLDQHQDSANHHVNFIRPQIAQ